MKKATLLFVIFSLAAISSYGQISIPESSDKYSDYVKKLEAGQTDIDYQDFRFSFLESKQFKVARKKATEFKNLQNEMHQQMDKSNYEEIIKITQKMLSIDYTSMIAHKILRQTYKIIGDTSNAEKHKTIQFGLLNSIVEKGDGKTCATAWPVIQIEEEYFILQMLDAKLKQQSVDNVGGLCDKMNVIMEGSDKTYYFETSKVFEGYEKSGLK